MDYLCNFSHDFIKCRWVSSKERLHISTKTIVVNLAPSDIVVESTPVPASISPLCSTILQNIDIRNVESVLLISVEPTKTGEIADIKKEEGWKQLSEQIPSYPKTTPLYKSPQDQLATLHCLPEGIVPLDIQAKDNCDYQVLLNIWYAPPHTDCGLHNTHDFFEWHTQICGVGRMQKFGANDASTLYEDQLLAEGQTHKVFCRRTIDGGTEYPWHRYYADTDVVWLAIEFHKKKV